MEDEYGIMLIKRAVAINDEMQSLVALLKEYFIKRDIKTPNSDRHPPLFFFDIESVSSGETTSNTLIKQLACVVITDNEEQHEFNVYIKRDVSVWSWSYWSDETHQSGVTMKEAGNLFIHFIKRHSEGHQNAYLIAHNCKAYDSRILITQLQNNGLSLPHNVMFIDTIGVFKKLAPFIKNPPQKNTLDQLYRRFMKEEYVDHHNALSDSKALLNIVKSLTNADNLGIPMETLFDIYVKPNAETLANAEKRVMNKNRK